MGHEAHKEPVDRTWCDDGVIPDKTNPDTDFVFARMTQATFRTVDARRGERILDVGCGRGLDLASQRETGAVLYGSDASRVMINRSADTFRDRGIALRLTHASAERLPFSDGSFDKVYCKGAIDHFYDPKEALQEMTRVLKPGGRLIVSVANFESLACRIGKLYNRLHLNITGKALPGPHCWEIPDDHVYKFDRPTLLSVLPGGLRIERLFGVSMLWGAPKWGRFLSGMPKRAADLILRTLDAAARAAPSLSDVIVLRARVPVNGAAEKMKTAPRSASSSAVRDGEKHMKKFSRLQGLILCLATVAAAVLFLIGVIMKSYWALAIPVAVGFLWLLGLAFWIGWTLLTIKVNPKEE